HPDEDRREMQRVRPDLRAGPVARGRSAERVPFERDEAAERGGPISRLEIRRRWGSEHQVALEREPVADIEELGVVDGVFDEDRVAGDDDGPLVRLAEG